VRNIDISTNDYREAAAMALKSACGRLEVGCGCAREPCMAMRVRCELSVGG
jgi:hypothetical protein